jgi:2-polyprenyl-3-methyl-5-hydroxy-6-metoxy-1,4-benzoquinol methylase
MEITKDQIYSAFLEIRSSFPFDGYLNDSHFFKYYQIISKIKGEYSPGSTILSIGSGPCDLEAILSKLNYSVTAVDDLSDQWHLIGENKQRIKNFARKFNVNLIVQPAVITQLNENSFDVVLMIDILEHLVGSPRDLLNYGISMLKPNGIIIIEVPNTVNLKNRITVLFGKSNQVSAKCIFWTVGKYRSHFREYTKPELKEIMSNLKLKNIEVQLLNIGTEITYQSTKQIPKKIAIFLYRFISGTYPNFRDTIIISGKKPKEWVPVCISLEKFKQCYNIIENYNLDKIPDDILIDQITKQEL